MKKTPQDILVVVFSWRSGEPAVNQPWSTHFACVYRYANAYVGSVNQA